MSVEVIRSVMDESLVTMDSDTGADVALQKQRKSRRWSKKDKRRVCNYFTEYCDVTSIHGFRYLGEQKRSCLEKLWWLVTIIISITCCAFLIFQTYLKWERSPVIVSFATKQTPIWQIPFPAVTICPETKSRQSVFNFTDLYLREYNNLSPREKREFEYISLVCNPRKAIVHLRSSKLDESILDFFDEIAPSFHNLSLKCVWMGKKYDCDSLFTPIMTDEGVCYTFNMLDRDELFNRDMRHFKNYLRHDKTSIGWTLEKGYGKDVKKDTYPRRALFSGATNGLQISMVAYDKDLDYICGDSLQGYKILLHHPAEIPRVSQQYFRVPLNQAIVAAIKPNMMTTSEELRSYNPSKRQCFFPNERKLRFFKIYTQQNCEIECLTNFTYNLCRCVDFHMPKNANTPICGPAKIECMKRAESSLLSSEIDFKLKEIEDEAQEALNATTTIAETFDNIWNKVHQIGKKKNDTEGKKIKKKNENNCDCLQSCTSLEYNSETSQSDWDWVQNFRGLNDPYDFLKMNYKTESGERLAHLSKLVLFFKDMQFIASERDELYGGTDFLANCGGLLGLFTGFSFLSLVEIIYFLSLRWFCNIRRKNAEKKD